MKRKYLQDHVEHLFADIANNVREHGKLRQALFAYADFLESSIPRLREIARNSPEKKKLAQECLLSGYEQCREKLYKFFPHLMQEREKQHLPTYE